MSALNLCTKEVLTEKIENWKNCNKKKIIKHLLLLLTNLNKMIWLSIRNFFKQNFQTLEFGLAHHSTIKILKNLKLNILKKL